MKELRLRINWPASKVAPLRTSHIPLTIRRHALGNRARKAGQGILTVRFEMPYPIWCTTCPKPTIIGQGVRFNAEKKKVGNYYSTPIFSFRMKHVVCGGWIEIRTDPKNTAYVVTEGAKKRDTGDDKVHEGEIVIRSDEERARLQNDAFAALEVTIDDRKQTKVDRNRIEELLEAKDKDWDDTFAANRRLRKVFRVERKVREKKEAITEGLKDKMSLGIDLLEETEDDRRRATYVEFGDFADLTSEVAISKARARPLFPGYAGVPTTPSGSARKPRALKAEQEVERRKEKLRQELRDNTRAALDPFLIDLAAPLSSSAILGIKRKRSSTPNDAVEQPESTDDIGSKPIPLVDYDSD